MKWSGKVHVFIQWAITSSSSYGPPHHFYQQIIPNTRIFPNGPTYLHPMSHHIISIQWAITSLSIGPPNLYSLSNEPSHHLYPRSHHISIQWAITLSLSNEPSHHLYPMSHHMISIQWAITSSLSNEPKHLYPSNEPPHLLYPMSHHITSPSCQWVPSLHAMSHHIIILLYQKYLSIYPPPLKYVIKSLPASPLLAGYVMLSKNTTTG